MKILLEMKYNGSGFAGFQVQPGRETVQSAIQDALERVYGVRYPVKGCSRTDAGVHALQYFASYETDKLIPTDRIPFALNSALDGRISVISAREVDSDFHVRYDVEYKEYEYLLHSSRIPDPFLTGRAFRLPKPIDSGMLERMRLAAESFIGEHDFRAFMSAGSSVSDTVRNIRYLQILEDGQLIRIRVAADGFLYNMVRIIVGTLIDTAYGKIEPSEVCTVIASGDRSLAGFTAPPEGLYLRQVVYRTPL